MPCHHPLRAWRTRDGHVVLGKDAADSTQLRLPCGGCLGCRASRAREWTLRCTLENQEHRHTSFTTLTYDDQHLPPTLIKRHLQLWLKRLRSQAAGPIRFFASGEYGETRGRPHYHALLFGLHPEHGRALVEQTWTMGHSYTVPVSPGAIAYVAGYNAKKIGWRRNQTEEQVDPETGEVFTWQPPFIQMSRRPGIGGHARQWPQSWRLYAVNNGYKQPVPRFLHESWKKQATEEEIEELKLEKEKQALLRVTTERALQAAEANEIAKQALKAAKRKYG